MIGFFCEGEKKFFVCSFLCVTYFVGVGLGVKICFVREEKEEVLRKKLKR